MTAPWRSGEISRLEPQKSCSAARAKQCQTYIEPIEPLRSIEFIWLHQHQWTVRLQADWHVCVDKHHHVGNLLEMPQEWTSWACWWTRTTQFTHQNSSNPSAQVTTVLLSKRTTWEQHGLSLENWQQTRVVHVSSVSDLVLCSSLLETPKWHNVTCDTMWQNIWQCHSGLAKGKTWENDAFSCFSSGYKSDTLFKSGLWGRNSSGGDWPHCRDRNQCLISPGMSKHILGWPSDSAQKICLIWIHRDPHPHLMEFSRLWYVMIALYSLWLYESMIIHDTPRNLRESLGFGLHGLATKFVQGLGDHRSEGRAADSNSLEQGMVLGMAWFGNWITRYWML